MGKQFAKMAQDHRDFIQQQQIFFNASAASQGRVNVSPRDVAALRIVDDSTVIYLDRTGSGNETAAHLLLNDRLTLMFCPSKAGRLSCVSTDAAVLWHVTALNTMPCLPSIMGE